MFEFLDSFRAALLLGKGHKYLQNGLYKEALAKAQKAKKLRMGTQLEWLYPSNLDCSTTRRARYFVAVRNAVSR